VAFRLVALLLALVFPRALVAAYVADGNHRSAAAAQLGKEHFLAVFFTSDDMRLEPYNRLVDAGNVPNGELLRQLESVFDVESLGSTDPRRDAEVGHMAALFFEERCITGLEVRVNSMGDGDDRDRYRDAVRAFLSPTIDEHCSSCHPRHSAGRATDQVCVPNT